MAQPTLPLKRFGIIGDVHTEDRRLTVALDYFEHQALEAILCVGDIVDGRGNVSETCRLLEEHDVVSVGGNHDRWFRRQQLRDLPNATPREAADGRSLAFIASLPATRRFATVDRDLLLCHGLGDDDMETIYPHDFGYELEVKDALYQLMRMEELGYVVCGHSHERMVRAFGHLTVINAGTLAGDHPCIGVIDLAEGHVTFLDITADRVLVSDITPLDRPSE